MSEDHDKSQVLRITTSGSTGEPFICYADRQQLEFRWAATLRSQEWTGYRFGDRCTRLWHQTIGMTARQAWQERLDARLSNRHFVPIFELSEPRLDETMELYDKVSVSAGVRGTQIILAPADYLKATRAKSGDIARGKAP